MRNNVHALFARRAGIAAEPHFLEPETAGSAADEWQLDVLRGRVLELSAATDGAALTAAMELVLEAQQQAEPTAWVTQRSSTFYPQDVEAFGVDLAALVVIQTDDVFAATRAADRLLRCGGFGLVVLDLADLDDARLPEGRLGRLTTLAQSHGVAVVLLTEKPRTAASLGSVLGLRAEPTQICGEQNVHEVVLEVLKDKQRGPGVVHRFPCRGPAGY